MFTVEIVHDQDCENPTSWDGQWTIYSFSNRHTNYRNPDTFRDEDGNLLPELVEKLENGLAFIVDYFEHGLCRWSISGTGPQCQWDNSRGAGIVVWEHSPEDMGAKTWDERKADCTRFLESYSDWCNGNCYGYVITQVIDESETEYASCYGYIGDDVLAGIASSLPAGTTVDDVEFIGEFAYIGDSFENHLHIPAA